jgi:hypothetical protein
VGINHGNQWEYGLCNNSQSLSTAVDISGAEIWQEKNIFVYPSRFLKNLVGDITYTHKIEYEHGYSKNKKRLTV